VAGIGEVTVSALTIAECPPTPGSDEVTVAMPIVTAADAAAQSDAIRNDPRIRRGINSIDFIETP
jgi:hypothetical protein